MSHLHPNRRPGLRIDLLKWMTAWSVPLMVWLVLPVFSNSMLCAQPIEELSLTDEVPSAEARKKIETLIQQLGADKYRDRKRAEVELQSMGMVVMEPLRAVRADADTEIRLRARRLVDLMRKQFISEGLPESIKSYFKNYDELPIDKRREVLIRTSQIHDALSSGAIARLARFEESEELSKRAALAILSSDVAAASEKKRKMQLVGIGFSERAACNWIRSYVRSYDAPDQAINELKQMLEDEQKLLNVGSSNTSRDITEQLSLRLIDCLVRADRETQAFDEMKELALASVGATTTLNSIDWLIEKKAWSTVVDLADEGKEKFKKDALLCYRLAEAFQLAGMAERSDQWAQDGFATEGGGLENYVDQYRSSILGLVQVISRSADPERQSRYSLARLLQEDRGLFDWAEKEYRAAIETEDPDLLYWSSHFLSELLYDQMKPGSAAKIREDVIARVEKKNGFQRIQDSSYAAKVHYLKAHQAKVDGETKTEIAEFTKALELDPDDIESMIGLYRVENPSDELKKQTASIIKSAAAKMLKGIQATRDSIKKNPRNRTTQQVDLAGFDNQYAWLVANTEGDFAEAIKCSEESLRISPNDYVYLDTLARCYYANGEFKKAVDFQERAVRGAPHTLQIQRQLTLFKDALAKSLDEDEADVQSIDEPANVKTDAKDANTEEAETEESVPVPNR